MNLTNSVYNHQVAQTLLITDGNQTLGSDYKYIASQYRNAIYPIIVVDSIRYSDLKITSVLTNRYSFLNNQFPVELTVAYEGLLPVKTNLEITRGRNVVHRKNITFSEDNSTKIIAFTLPSEEVGLQKYSVQIAPLNNEKNIQNNRKEFAIEVIDESTDIFLVSDIKHPDMGVLKKSIETNEQRIVTVYKPKEALRNIEEAQLIILFQPNSSFSELLQ